MELERKIEQVSEHNESRYARHVKSLSSRFSNAVKTYKRRVAFQQPPVQNVQQAIDEAKPEMVSADEEKIIDLTNLPQEDLEQLIPSTSYSRYNQKF